jgi:hypothetical protein
VLDFRIDHLFTVAFVRPTGNRPVTTNQASRRNHGIRRYESSGIGQGYIEVNTVFPR